MVLVVSSSISAVFRKFWRRPSGDRHFFSDMNPFGELLELKSLFRLAVRTSRCGRDNPGSIPGLGKKKYSLMSGISSFVVAA